MEKFKVRAFTGASSLLMTACLGTPGDIRRHLTPPSLYAPSPKPLEGPDVRQVYARKLDIYIAVNLV
ncbi:hypothetical protein BDW69DRAFT_156826 [Aspergillus filifer]